MSVVNSLLKVVDCVCKLGLLRNSWISWVILTYINASNCDFYITFIVL